MSRKVLLVVALVLGLGALTAGFTLAAADSEESLSGPDARRASAAALRSTGGGTVKEVERGDDGNSVYEVEVRRPDGTIAEVQLDAAFAVIETVTGDDD